MNVNVYTQSKCHYHSNVNKQMVLLCCVSTLHWNVENGMEWMTKPFYIRKDGKWLFSTNISSHKIYAMNSSNSVFIVLVGVSLTQAFPVSLIHPFKFWNYLEGPKTAPHLFKMPYVNGVYVILFMVFVDEAYFLEFVHQNLFNFIKYVNFIFFWSFFYYFAFQKFFM